MKLKINPTKNSWAIRQTFNMLFPFLKIEFFNSKHISGEATSAKNMITGDRLLGEINPLIKEGFITLHPEDTVAYIEQTFQQEFGLSVQVFRKQHDVWIETTKTDQLTLAEQNEKAKLASAPATRTEPADRYLEDGQY